MGSSLPIGLTVSVSAMTNAKIAKCDRHSMFGISELHTTRNVDPQPTKKGRPAAALRSSHRRRFFAVQSHLKAHVSSNWADAGCPGHDRAGRIGGGTDDIKCRAGAVGLLQGPV